MRRLASGTVVLTATALLWSTASPLRELTVLRRTAEVVDPFDPLVAVLALLAWAVLAWLASVLAASLAAQLPGAAGRGAATLARLLTPAALRTSAEVLLGVSMAVGVAAPTPALADTGTGLSPIPAAAERGLIPVMPVLVSAPPVPAPLLAPVLPAPLPAPVPAPVPAGPGLDWPGTGALGERQPARPPAPGRVHAARTAPLARAGTSARSGAAPSTPAPGAVTGRRAPIGRPAATGDDVVPHPVVVRPGDSLWRIAATSLSRSADAARIARAWPRWWAANRAVIGPNPDLIQPGMELRPPI